MQTDLPESRQMRRCRFQTVVRRLILCSMLLHASWAGASGQKMALLVGVGKNPAFTALQGPQQDVAALREVLSTKWAYEVESLVDAEATRSAVLDALTRLERRTRAGDEVLIYISGHGTSALDWFGSGLNVPDDSGAFVAFDTQRDGRNLLVGRTDLRPLLERLDAGGRKVWFIADACFSGAMVRNVQAIDGKGATLGSRLITLADSKDAGIAIQARESFAARSGDTPWPYRNLVFLSASSEGEAAVDIPERALSTFPTLDGKPHGAMTDALLRVLNGDIPADADSDGALSLQEIHAATAGFMHSRPYGQMPQRLPALREDDTAVGSRALMRGSAARALDASTSVAAPVRVFIDPAAGLDEAQVRRLKAVPGVEFGAFGPDSFTVGLDVDRRDLVLRPRGYSLTSSEYLARASRNDLASIADNLHQLAWVGRIEALARQGLRGALAAEISPAALGVVRVVGEKLTFWVQPDRDAVLLILNVNAKGDVSVLFPFNASELAPLRGGKGHQLAGFVVEPPEGADVQLWFAFDSMPIELERLMKLTNLPPGDARLREIEKMISANKGKFTFARTEFRTYEKAALQARR